jgi:phosphatidylglycerophosphatase C
VTARGVAAFDFDGTITQRDTLAPFLWRVGRPIQNLVGWASLLPLVVDRDSASRRLRAKERMFKRVLAGRPHSALAAEGRAYASELPSRFRTSALDRVTWHKDQGHELILITASLRLYAEPAALALGFDHVIAVDLDVDSSDVVTGDIIGPNVRGPEKAVRLRQYLSDEAVELWGYGDSPGDTEFMAMADHASWTGRSR